MRFHFERFSVYQMFARMMEVELQQLVRLSIETDSAAGRDVHLNCMAIVYDLDGGRLIVDCNFAGRGLDSAVQIDGGLLESDAANPESWRQVAPMLGTGRTGISPLRCAAVTFGRAMDRCLSDLGAVASSLFLRC